MRVYGPAQPGTSDAVIYTAPYPVRITDIWFCNTTAAAATLRLDLNSSGAATRILPDVSVAANTAFVFNGDYDLEAGDTLRARQGTANACTMTITGVRA